MGFLADSLQAPIAKENGYFVKIKDKEFKLSAEMANKLILNAYMVLAQSDDEMQRYPNRHVYNLVRFTDLEKDAITWLLTGLVLREA